MDLCSALSLQKPAALWAKCIEYAHHHSKRDPEKCHSGSTSYREHQVGGGGSCVVAINSFSAQEDWKESTNNPRLPPQGSLELDSQALTCSRVRNGIARCHLIHTIHWTVGIMPRTLASPVHSSEWSPL